MRSYSRVLFFSLSLGIGACVGVTPGVAGGICPPPPPACVVQCPPPAPPPCPPHHVARKKWHHPAHRVVQEAVVHVTHVIEKVVVEHVLIERPMRVVTPCSRCAAPPPPCGYNPCALRNGGGYPSGDPPAAYGPTGAHPTGIRYAGAPGPSMQNGIRYTGRSCMRRDGSQGREGYAPDGSQLGCWRF